MGGGGLSRVANCGLRNGRKYMVGCFRVVHINSVLKWCWFCDWCSYCDFYIWLVPVLRLTQNWALLNKYRVPSILSGSDPTQCSYPIDLSTPIFGFVLTMGDKIIWSTPVSVHRGIPHSCMQYETTRIWWKKRTSPTPSPSAKVSRFTIPYSSYYPQLDLRLPPLLIHKFTSTGSH